MSDYLRELPFLWVDVDDEPGPESDRAYIERNAIALVSNYGKSSIDPRSSGWLGNDSPSQKIRESGLWNVTHVDESSDPTFLDRLTEAVESPHPLLSSLYPLPAESEFRCYGESRRKPRALARG
nr:hypothetical protein [Halorubrum halophilum]